MLDRAEIMRRINTPRNYRWAYIEKLETLIGVKAMQRKYNTPQTRFMLKFVKEMG